jgi:hypothetical protein
VRRGEENEHDRTSWVFWFFYFFFIFFLRFQICCRWVWLLPVLGYGVSGDGFRCCWWFEVDGVWLIFAFVRWGCGVGFRVGFGGFRGGSGIVGWVSGVSRWGGFRGGGGVGFGVGVGVGVGWVSG